MTNEYRRLRNVANMTGRCPVPAGQRAEPHHPAASRSLDDAVEALLDSWNLNGPARELLRPQARRRVAARRLAGHQNDDHERREAQNGEST